MALNYTVEELLLDESFVKYCLDPDPETVRNWEILIIENKISRDTIDEAKTLLKVLSPELGRQEIDEEVNKLREQMNEPVIAKPYHTLIIENPEEYAVSHKNSHTRIFISLAFILSLSLVIYYALIPAKTAVPEIVAAFSTKTGEQKKIVLPDGTSVILNSNTRLYYDKGFNETERNVRLSGKAFFKVAKNPEKPFTVSSRQFSTTALGTAFYVSSDSTDNYSVRLLEGKVKINTSRENESAVLTPGEEILWQRGDKHFHKQSYDTTYLSYWASGKIMFRKTPLHEAFSILQQWYGVQIIDNRKEKKEITINGTYENVLLEDILKVICFSLSCNIHYDDEKIIIE